MLVRFAQIDDLLAIVDIYNTLGRLLRPQPRSDGLTNTTAPKIDHEE